MRGVLHCHSENSLKECPILIGDLIESVKEKGYDAVVLSDHSSMTGIAEFVKKAKDNGIKPIPGLELEIKSGSEYFSIILMAKDYTGYVGLCKAVSEANKTLNANGIAVLDKAILHEFFDHGSRFHGHVAASCGGMHSELFYYACERLVYDKEIAQHKRRMEVLGLPEEEAVKKTEQLSSVLEEIKTLNVLRKGLASRTGKNFSKKEERLNKLIDPAERQKQKERLDIEKADCLAAEKELASVKRKIANRKKKSTEIQKEIDRLRNQIEEKNSLQNLISDSPPPDRHSLECMEHLILEYQELFGKDNFFIELMYHGQMEEAMAFPLILKAIRKTGCKTLISNDVHILDGSEDSVLKWQILRSLSNNQWEEFNFPASSYDLKSYEELENMLLGIVPEDIIRKSFLNMERFFDECEFDWPEEKHYPVYVDHQGRSANEALEQTVRANISRYFTPEEWTEEYEERLMTELPVIQKTGYADYTLIISDILEEGRKGKHDGEPGSFIGPGRGSGAGSIVNYLMGITHIDPLKYDLIFERYLNIERISPPDIDSDIATSIRDLLVRFITQKYSILPGKVGVCTIVTKSRLTAKAAIRAAGRALSSKMYGNAAKLYSVSDKISKAVPNDLHITLDKCINELSEVFTDDTEKEIISYACLIEGLLCGYSTHAAGMIITDNGDVTEYAPVMNVGTNEDPVWNIQFDKEESESIGLLKLDALGLTSLDIISNTIQRVYHTRGILIDIDHIPFEKKVFKEIYGKGKTNGVFQCESAGMKRMWTQLKPDCIEDIIAGVALYRPGPMEFIDDYIKGKRNPQNIRYLAPQLEPILKKTYGCVVYQEQVMRIVRDLAGYSMGRSDLVRRAMSKKKESIMNAERKNFVYGNTEEGIPGCISNGISEEAAHQIYDLMVDFARYAFNESHAAAYAIVSYQTAWLKYYYPKEFLIEVMNQQKPENIPVFIDECRKYGFEVLRPDINRSIEGFTEYDGKILYGLGNVKGVKGNSSSIIRNRKTGYTSFGQYVLESGVNKSVTKALIKSGAFSVFCNSRSGLLQIYETLYDMAARVKSLNKRILEKQAKLSESLNQKTKDRIRLSLKRDMTEADQLKRQILGYPTPDFIKDDMETLLEMEKDSIYTYISAHPLDRFDYLLSSVDPIISIGQSVGRCEVSVLGIVSDLHVFRTKKNDLEMCVFTCEDRSEKIKVVCFPEVYAKYKYIIKEESVLRIAASAQPDSKDKEEWVLIPKRIESPYMRAKQIILEVNSEKDWEESLQNLAAGYFTQQGNRLILFCKDNGSLIVTDHFVTKDILQSGLLCMEVRKRISE